MAIVQNPIIGRASGKLGNAVFAKQFSKNTARSQAMTINDANSEGQQDQRGKMKQIGHLIMMIVATLIAYLPKSLSDMPFGSWLVKSLAKASTFVLSTGVFTFDFSKLVGGPVSFFGSNAMTAKDGVDMDIVFEVSSLNPIVPMTTNTFNVVVFSKTLELRYARQIAATVTFPQAKLVIPSFTDFDIQNTDIVIISMNNEADANNNYPKTAYKINSSKRLNSFMLACAVSGL